MLSVCQLGLGVNRATATSGPTRPRPQACDSGSHLGNRDTKQEPQPQETASTCPWRRRHGLHGFHHGPAISRGPVLREGGAQMEETRAAAETPGSYSHFQPDNRAAGSLAPTHPGATGAPCHGGDPDTESQAAAFVLLPVAPPCLRACNCLSVRPLGRPKTNPSPLGSINFAASFLRAQRHVFPGPSPGLNLA